jgi:hypothetical protein
MKTIEDAISFITTAELQRAVQFAASAKMPHLPALTWAAGGHGALIWITAQTAAWPQQQIARAGTRPVLVIIAADMGEDRDPDPHQWRCGPELRSWTRAAIVHASGGAPQHYRSACAMAEQVGRCAIIECTPRTASAWVRLVACPRTLLIYPNDGQHPVPAQGAMQ